MKIVRIIIYLLIALLIGLVVTYIVATAKLKKLTPEIQKNLPGDFIELEDGVINYCWQGNKNGEKVILVNGLSTPKYVWDEVAQALVKEGYRVLTFDHYGRGFSDRPKTKYNIDFYDRELINLLAALDVNEPINLVGYSMGGGVATVFAGRHPKMVKKLLLVAPAGFLPKPSGLVKMLSAPLIGEWLSAVYGKKSLLMDIKKEVEAGNCSADMVSKFEEQYQYKGYMYSILSTVRNYPLFDLSNEYRKVGMENIPTYSIWGTADQSVPIEGAAKAQAAIPNMKEFILENAEHSMTYARANEVSEILIDALSR